MKQARPYRRQDPPFTVKPAESPIKAFLQYSALPLTLGTALLYLLGWIYGTSYLAAWDLPISLFPLTKDQSLISGFFHILLLLANSMSFVAKVMVVLLVVMIATMTSCYKPLYDWLGRQLYRVFSPLKGRVVINSTHDRIMDKILLLAAGIGLILTFVLFAALLCGWVDKQAKERAAKERAAITTGQTSSVKLPVRARLYVKGDGNVFSNYSGYLIENSTTHAALYSKNKGMTIFPLANVARIEMPEKLIKTVSPPSPYPSLRHKITNYEDR